ncbi:flagellar motor protein MotB [Aestuariibius insulae]|uniref:OmpA/MotB family protein n=1 Tax=Aestuariibius insulae TaxID=2058287 RepID=UPI00345F0221
MAKTNERPIIIKRRKVVGGDGHHGGAWKVAYADFVTAMMAFFMLMWLLNATTEKQRKGIADYFSPTIPINRISGGGSGAMGGDSVMAEEDLAFNGEVPDRATGAIEAGDSTAAAFAQIEEMLTGSGGESRIADDLLAHIVTRVTDEGLIVELFSLPEAPLFRPGTEEPTDVLLALTDVVEEAFSLVRNDVAVGAHVAAEPIVIARPSVWPISVARAERMHDLLRREGIADARFARVTGHADRELYGIDPLSIRNDRIELVLLRSDG